MGRLGIVVRFLWRAKYVLALMLLTLFVIRATVTTTAAGRDQAPAVACDETGALCWFVHTPTPTPSVNPASVVECDPTGQQCWFANQVGNR
jgi:hypothetical protein